MLNQNKFRIIDDGMTLTEVHEEFCALLDAGNTHHHRMGLLYNHMVKKKLAQNAKYKNALDYFSKNIKQVSRSALLMYSAVAKAFSEELTVRFGVTRLNLLLVYKEAADLKLNSEDPGSMPVEVPAADGTVTAKPFSECSVEELRKAINRKRKPVSSKPIPPHLQAQLEAFREAAIARFPEDAPVQVTARNHQGQVLISFRDIPMTDLDGLAEILLDGSSQVAKREPELLPAA